MICSNFVNKTWHFKETTYICQVNFTKYGKTKREGEKIIEKNFKNKKTKFCVGRIFSFTDKNQNKPFVIPSLIEKIKKSRDKKIIIKNIDHYRDFLPTKDIVLAIKVLFNKNRRIYLLIYEIFV